MGVEALRHATGRATPIRTPRPRRYSHGDSLFAFGFGGPEPYRQIAQRKASDHRSARAERSPRLRQRFLARLADRSQRACDPADLRDRQHRRARQHRSHGRYSRPGEENLLEYLPVARIRGRHLGRHRPNHLLFAPYRTRLRSVQYGFKNFIVSGGGIEFIRPWTERVYGILPEQVIGSSVKTKFELRGGRPVIVRLPELNFNDDKGDKPVAINQHIGRRPIAAFGNSTGDQQMLEYTQSGSGARFLLLVLHDDAARESPTALREDCRTSNWAHSRPRSMSMRRRMAGPLSA